MYIQELDYPVSRVSVGYIIQLLVVKHINYLRGKELKFQEGKKQAHSNRPIWDILPNKFFFGYFYLIAKDFFSYL